MKCQFSRTVFSHEINCLLLKFVMAYHFYFVKALLAELVMNVVFIAHLFTVYVGV